MRAGEVKYRGKVFTPRHDGSEKGLSVFRGSCRVDTRLKGLFGFPVWGGVRPYSPG